MLAVRKSKLTSKTFEPMRKTAQRRVSIIIARNVWTMVMCLPLMKSNVIILTARVNSTIDMYSMSLILRILKVRLCCSYAIITFPHKTITQILPHKTFKLLI